MLSFTPVEGPSSSRPAGGKINKGTPCVSVGVSFDLTKSVQFIVGIKLEESEMICLKQVRHRQEAGETITRHRARRKKGPKAALD